MRPSELALLAVLGLPAGAPDWRDVEPGIELAYPEDHGAHPAYQTEWWYLTGNVEDAQGRPFGLQLTIFRRGLDPAPPREGASALRARHVLAGHLAVADVREGETHFAERLRRQAPPFAHAARGDLDLALDDWTLLRRETGSLVARASDAATGIGLDLTLEPTKPAVLHGRAGYSRKGDAEGNASAYMSWTRLAVAGTLVVDGEPREVRGEAWFDHEFGSSVLEDGTLGWDWFGLQLDGGRELMAFVLRGEDGPRVSAGTWVEPDGSTRPLEGGDVRLTPLAEWTSPRTGATYPARWSLELPALGERLVIEPRTSDAELVSGGSTGVVYWEGPVSVSGTSEGRGYAELTGYAGALGARF